MIEDDHDPAHGRRGRHHRAHQPMPHLDQKRAEIRRIAVQADDTEAGSCRLDLAIHLAKALSADVIGVGSLPPEPATSVLPSDTAGEPAPPLGLSVGDTGEPYTSAPGSLSDLWHERAAELGRWFESRMAGSPQVAHQWMTIWYGGSEEMVGLAKTSDLTILGQHSSGIAAPSPVGFQPEAIAMASGRPALIVPSTWRTATTGRTVIIAWDGSREAVRAVHDAMPLMRDAMQIVILEIDRVAQGAGPDTPGATAACALLERHGFQAFVETCESGPSGPAAALADRIEQFKADLLVAGLFHHSQLREAIRGGVSHELLRHAPIPVLLSH